MLFRSSEQRGYDGKSLLVSSHDAPASAAIVRFAHPTRVDEQPRGYDRDRSRSPRRDIDDSRARSASPMGRDNR